MRRFPAICMVAALCVLLAACNEAPAPGPKIGVVDLNRLMRDSVPGKAGLKFIEAQQTRLQSGLDEIQEKLEKNPEDEAAMRELQRLYATSQQKIQTEGQNVVGALFDAIQGALNNFRAKNGYALLIRSEAIDSFDPALDVTNALMAEVDKIQIDFKTLAKKELAPAETAEEAKVDDVKAASKPEEAAKEPAPEKAKAAEKENASGGAAKEGK